MRSDRDIKLRRAIRVYREIEQEREDFRGTRLRLRQELSAAAKEHRMALRHCKMRAAQFIGEAMEAGVSQRQIAEQVGVSVAMVSFVFRENANTAQTDRTDATIRPN